MQRVRYWSKRQTALCLSNALDKEVSNFEVISYDFLEKGILSPYDGVLGLDFFEQTILTLDFIHQDVWLTE
jgi:hypothetical protein